jgi:hypothetical protein
MIGAVMMEKPPMVIEMARKLHVPMMLPSDHRRTDGIVPERM